MGIMENTSVIVRLYGIPNCSSVKKAFDWLDGQGIKPLFHDFKKLGIDSDTLWRWMRQHDWQVVLNRRGTTWRQLDAAQQAAVTDAPSAIRLMCEKPSLIKRPVIEWPSGAITVGFEPQILMQTIKS